MNDELTTLIIKELSRHHDRQAIVQQICERGGLSWKQAEQLVTLVEAKHARTIVTRQAPLLFFLSIGTLLVGIGLCAFNLDLLMAFTQQNVLDQVLSLPGNYYRILELIGGLGMTVGGLIGLWRAFGVIFPD